MDSVKDILKARNSINVNSDSNNKINNNVNNDTRNKYKLNREKFTPNTAETQLAEKISSNYNDLENFAFYLSVVNRLGVDRAAQLDSTVQANIREKAIVKDGRYKVRYPNKYFTWCYKHLKLLGI